MTNPIQPFNETLIHAELKSIHEILKLIRIEQTEISIELIRLKKAIEKQKKSDRND